MRKPKCDWWPNVVGMVKHYPGRTAAKEIGIQLAPQRLRECEAVGRTLEIVRLLPDGDDRVELIRRIYWQGAKRNIKDVFEGLAATVSEAENWHGDFIRMVAIEIGYVT